MADDQQICKPIASQQSLAEILGLGTPTIQYHKELTSLELDASADEQLLLLCRKLQQAVHFILASVEDSPSDTDSLEESIQNLQIPATAYVGAAAKLAATAVVYEATASAPEAAADSAAVPAASTELSMQGSQTMSPHARCYHQL